MNDTNLNFMASSLTKAFLSLILMAIIFEATRAQPGPNIIPLGSSLHPSIQPAWYSNSKRFAFGFFPEGNGFRVGIWIGGSGNNITVVWTAYRDQLVVSSGARVQFGDGKLELQHEDGNFQNIAGISERASYASMLDQGNFVLYDQNYSILWESFKFPTDTIVGGQLLDVGKELISSASPTNHSSGRFRLLMQADANLVAYPIVRLAAGALLAQDAYWASNTGTGPVFHADTGLFLSDYSGDLQLVDHIDIGKVTRVLHQLNSTTNASLYRATLGHDGNFRLFSHTFVSENNPKVLIQWEAVHDVCDVKGICGYNSYCARNGGEPLCTCIPGFSFSDVNETNGDCKRNFTRGKCIGGREESMIMNKMTIMNLQTPGDDQSYFRNQMPEEEDCAKSCLEDCDCDAAFYPSNSFCSKYKLPLKFLKSTTISTESSTAFFKQNKDNIITNPESDPEKQPWSIILALSLSFTTYSCTVLAFFAVLLFKFHMIKHRKLLLETRSTGLIKGFTLQTYTYRELKNATKDFQQELGRGAFGAVHKGTFDKGKSFVAVKRLEKLVEEGEREFRAEMKVIGRTRHKNLVRLFGYCIEGSKRLLIYEYMSNGSLADLLFKTGLRPDWNERVRIALDVARGILYLHEECEAPIIHCDIKPQNILIDQNWHAKISDFGLAKLLMPDQTRTNTGARGTRGYIAPEWNKNIPISVKVDIYSFGVVLLEIISCRRNLEINLMRPEEALLSAWAYQCFVEKEMGKLVSGEEVDRKSLERMVSVALWCIQDEPALRFPMKTVMLMLEGIVEVPIPPCPSDY